MEIIWISLKQKFIIRIKSFGINTTLNSKKLLGVNTSQFKLKI
jgi:hypothetical protein